MKVQRTNQGKLNTVKQSVTLSKQVVETSKHYLNSKNMQDEENEKKQEQFDPGRFLSREEYKKWSRLSARKKEQYIKQVQNKKVHATVLGRGTPKQNAVGVKYRTASKSNTMVNPNNVGKAIYTSKAIRGVHTSNPDKAVNLTNVGEASNMSKVMQEVHTSNPDTTVNMSHIDKVTNTSNVGKAANMNHAVVKAGNAKKAGNTSNASIHTVTRNGGIRGNKGMRANVETSGKAVATKSAKTIEKGTKTIEKGSKTAAQTSANAAGTAAGATAGAASGGAAVAAKGAASIANKFREHLQNSVDTKTEQLKAIQSQARDKVANAQVHSLNSGVQFLGNLAITAATPVVIIGMQFAVMFVGTMILVMITIMALVALVSILTAILTMLFTTTTSERVDNVGLSAQVEAYRPLVSQYAQIHGIEEYVPYLLAIMQVESGGNGGDPMQSSESQGMPPNTITDPEVSIDMGVRHFANALRLSEAKGTDIYTSIQSYNFGTGYIDYVVRNGGKHKFEIAESFSREKANGVTVKYSNPIAVAKNGGYRYRYGNMFYVELVNQYIQIVSRGSGSVPIYLQGDPAWKSIPYAGTTIGYAGCGLTAAASCFSALTGEEITPLTLQQMVGNSCTVGGVNDMGKFAAFGKNRWGLQHTGALGISRGNISSMLNQLDQGHFVFASMQGSYPGGVGYIANGHILLLYKEGNAYYMMDPAYSENSREWSVESLNQIRWKYCYGIWN